MKTVIFFNEKLKKLRQEKGFTQAEMVTYISYFIGREISVSMYQKWENLNNPVDIETAINIAKSLGVDTKEITL